MTEKMKSHEVEVAQRWVEGRIIPCRKSAHDVALRCEWFLCVQLKRTSCTCME